MGSGFHQDQQRPMQAVDQPVLRAHVATAPATISPTTTATTRIWI